MGLHGELSSAIVGAMLEVEHLTRRYGPLTAVDDISFQTRSGEILGFLGPNGAGKTTKIGRASCRERV